MPSLSNITKTGGFMLRHHLTARKSFMIFMSYLLFGTLASWWAFDRHYYKGPQYQAPETTEAVVFFRQKCAEFKIVEVCNYGFQNLVRVDLVNHVWYQFNINSDVTTIGLTEFSVFSPLTKISIDRQLLIDKVLFDSTVVHELGHAILNLTHNDEKPAIMNSAIGANEMTEDKYKVLVDEMFKDFKKSLN